MDTSTVNEMIAVPPGQVTLSDRRTQRSWQVQLAPYRLGAFPVTQALYAQVTGARPSSAEGDRLPVEGVSWWDAVRFCNALSRHEGFTPAYFLHADPEGAEGLEAAEGPEGTEGVEWDTAADGYRLPTEAEWEHACRAGTTGPRYGPLDDIAWYRGNSDERIHDVGGKQPNPWGLHDMLGNVWDWCWDVYDAEVYGTYRVLRGGGWFDEHWSCRASARRRSHPSYQVDDVGFRVARSATP
ncbi:sulfatase modifying factor 1 [Streptomyces phaeochromogenes]|jgi:formylglycine-generating enzyme required for sulfatase activity|uniref:formylglycine-generating enzyme family protein n=1 Tax=Streptomyces phaeochromogenes TaxID=1923 RepID=UPI00278E84C3|nr:formylglycine-generating enzyme family protein [Streptomyces phaeochromogenes]MDQ0947469.1 sulfatase modifying factor 1 [Streptomyces phaeochromogenes]